MKLEFPNLDSFLLAALNEDIGTGDITTTCCVSVDAVSTGKFIAKENGIICGLGIISRVFTLLDNSVSLTARVEDGTAVNKGDVIADIAGPSQAILTGERTALNILQYLSGIATATAAASGAAVGTKTKIVDTRKVIPGMRTLAKYAVRCGGGCNHRFGLSDGILIKDNHIAASGGIANAITLARTGSPHTLKIEIEVESIDQVTQALDSGADIIMLDNMSIEDMTEAVKLINGRALTEASGNMGDRDIKAVAATGVDFISIGALTHTVRALDISLRFA